jgi:catechol 2,3-dioxygenase-like lactoylglutathione lyase family enzyme
MNRAIEDIAMGTNETAIHAFRRADHTGITVRSLKDALHFWVDVLGFRFVEQTHFENSVFLENVVGVKDAEVTLAMVEGPDGHLVELLEYHAPGDRQFLKPRSCDVGSVHLAYMVDHLDDLLSKVERAGWMRLGEPQTVLGGARNGLRIAYIRGPDGVTLEFLQAPLRDDGHAASWKNSLGA